ncbi:hypothetical protein J0A67_08320 [Algoriphagus aestuariicola]|uniref:DUF4168 domain-containing protein n=1 Tax=Algoriphagus aestuariicola TaxID=1852016 RepID=A0ABS3BNH5_9BACT|nr:hypothetical protein [Algoriphagus aestuariicola]MBN7800862.1 hypothetical protein [Algoriphagus aestuariicola]
MRKIWMFLFLFGGLSLAAFAQEAAVEEEVTDEELMKFANVEFMTSEFVEKKTDELKDMILNNEVIDGGARYNEIKAAWGDAAKEAEIKLTDDERAAYKAIKDFQDSLQESVVEYKTELIKDDNVLGVSIYNKVNGAIKEDPAMKEKLDQMVEEMKTKEEDGATPSTK